MRRMIAAAALGAAVVSLVPAPAAHASCWWITDDICVGPPCVSDIVGGVYDKADKKLDDALPDRTWACTT